MIFSRCKEDPWWCAKYDNTKIWRRRRMIWYFSNKCTFGGCKVCNVILDGDSKDDIVSQKADVTLKLTIERHPLPYNIARFWKGNKVQVISYCSRFTIGDTINDEVWCNVVSTNFLLYWKHHGCMTKTLTTMLIEHMHSK